MQRWVREQEGWLELETMPAGSAEAREMFPGLQQIASADELVVISDEGEVYLDNRAWIMCLYALVKVSGVGVPAGASNALAAGATGV